MKPGDKLTFDELNTLLNSHQPGTVGHNFDADAIKILDELGRMIGYGRLAQLADRLGQLADRLGQLAELLGQVQEGGELKSAAEVKRLRFAALGWPLPDDFEEVAAK